MRAHAHIHTYTQSTNMQRHFTAIKCTLQKHAYSHFHQCCHDPPPPSPLHTHTHACTHTHTLVDPSSTAVWHLHVPGGDVLLPASLHRHPPRPLHLGLLLASCRELLLQPHSSTLADSDPNKLLYDPRRSDERPGSCRCTTGRGG